MQNDSLFPLLGQIQKEYSHEEAQNAQGSNSLLKRKWI
jgi:hypothetical protein